MTSVTPWDSTSSDGAPRTRVALGSRETGRPLTLSAPPLHWRRLACWPAAGWGWSLACPPGDGRTAARVSGAGTGRFQSAAGRCCWSENRPRFSGWSCSPEGEKRNLKSHNFNTRRPRSTNIHQTKEYLHALRLTSLTSLIYKLTPQSLLLFPVYFQQHTKISCICAHTGTCTK